MKNKSLIFMLPFLLLSTVGCGNKESESAKETDKIDNTPSIHKPTDEELNKIDDVLTYDNLIKMSGGQETADPFVYRFNGKYYLYPTTNGRAVRCYVSSDMFSWEPVDNGVNGRGYCYEYSKDGIAAPKDGTPFAPEVIYFNGMFYMITSPSGKGHYILSSERPEGPFNVITENVQRSIDGSFFITDDERILMYGAGSGCIQGYEMNDDFTDFRQNEYGSYFQTPIGACHMGGWNEGPYLLNRYGEYYMTWTGTNYINRDYRVDYCYAPKGSNLLSSSSFERKKTVLLETGDSFWGLGHSCTVLGPDLDSYYIAYHNMIPGRTRYLNFSRLSFDGPNMVTNFVRPDDCVGTELPPFYSEGTESYELVGNKYLSSLSTKDTFSVEFNTIGEGKMIFSYQDEKNYSYIEFINNTLTVHTVTDGAETKIAEGTLSHEFDTGVYHNYRLQYKDKRLVLYFDNMMKIDEDNITLNGGKIGYPETDFTEIGYSAFSNAALGSSDKKAYNDEVSLASNYDPDLSYLTTGSGIEEVTSKKLYNNTGSHNLILKNDGDFATYRMYAHAAEKYQLSIRIPGDYVASSFQVKVDGAVEKEVTLNGSVPKKEDGDALVKVADIELTPGAHNITFVNTGDTLALNEIHYEEVNAVDGYDLDLANDDLSSLVGRKGSYTKLTQTKTGIRSENEGAFGLLTEEEYSEATIETDMTVHSIEPDGYAGIIMNVKDYSIEEDDVNDPTSYTGYQFVVANGKAAMNYADFNFSNQIKGGKFFFEDGKTYHLKAVQQNNNYKFYIDDKVVIDCSSNVGPLRGRAGVFSHNADVSFSTFKVSQ